MSIYIYLRGDVYIYMYIYMYVYICVFQRSLIQKPIIYIYISGISLYACVYIYIYIYFFIYTHICFVFALEVKICMSFELLEKFHDWAKDFLDKEVFGYLLGCIGQNSRFSFAQLYIYIALCKCK